jgi:hypothetical protein
VASCQILFLIWKENFSDKNTSTKEDNSNDRDCIVSERETGKETNKIFAEELTLTILNKFSK